MTNPFGLSFSHHSSSAPVFADIDGDADLDAFVGDSATGREAIFFRNVGSVTAPRFPVPASNPFGLDAGGRSGTRESVALVDIDGDGDLDAFVGTEAGPLRFFPNVGTKEAALFGEPFANPFGFTYRDSLGVPSFVDADADGDFDAYLWDGLFQETVFFRNQGTAESPSFASFGIVPQLSGEYLGTPSFADVDGDGDLDAFLLDATDYGVLYFQNVVSAKHPFFTAPVAQPFGLTSAAIEAGYLPVFFDFDDDGDLDAFFGKGFGEVELLANVGSPTAPQFVAALTNPFGLGPVEFDASPSFADIDDDGDTDGFVGSGRGIVFFRNDAEASSSAACPVAPSQCLVAATSATLQIDESAPGREKLRADLRMPKGWQQQFGDPEKFGGTSYALCVYSPTELVAELRVDRAGTLCSGKPCWTIKSGRKIRYSYRDRLRAEDGTERIDVKHDADEDRLQWRAGNRSSREQTALPTGLVAGLPTTPGSPVVLQVLASDASPCRTAELRTLSNAGGRYAAVGP